MKKNLNIETDFIVLDPDKRASIEQNNASLYEKLDQKYDNFIGHELISCPKFYQD